MTMNKRSFIKFFSGMAAAPVLSPFMNLMPEIKLKNWAGNIEYGTENLFTASSVEQARDFLRKQTKLKVLGTRHCFNTIADSKNQFLSLKPADELVAVNAEERTVTVDGSMTYGRLCPLLHEKGFALHNLASLPHISIAGSCTTATHGSGLKNGNLATAVSALELITANGDLIQLSRQKDGEKFAGAVVGLGALGVITKVTLNIQPAYMMRQYVYLNMPLDQVKEHFEAIESCAYSVSLFTDWRNKNVNEVWIKSRTEEGQAFAPAPEFFGAKAAARNFHPIAALSAENCTEQLGVPGPWYERLPHFRMGFTPSAGKELQSEYFVPHEHAVEAILAVEKLHEQVSPHLLITEIRTIAGDDLWMSPCYKQPSVTIHFTWKQDWPAVGKLLPIIEKELAPFKARPHWGKLFTMPPAELRSHYEKLSEFMELCKTYDPNGKFRNEFLNGNLFGA
jgi:xylitol oxidase